MKVKEITESRQYPQPLRYYFSYGMLCDPRNMEGVEFIGRAELPNFKFEMGRFANVYPEPGSVTQGCLWHVDRKTLAQLDRVEDHPWMYDRRTVRIYSQGKPVEAELYTMTPRYRSKAMSVPPRRSYIDSITRGYSAGGVPLEQLKQGLRDLAQRINTGR